MRGQTYFALWKIVGNYLLGRKIWNHFASSQFLLLHQNFSKKYTHFSYANLLIVSVYGTSTLNEFGYLWTWSKEREPRALRNDTVSLIHVVTNLIVRLTRLHIHIHWSACCFEQLNGVLWILLGGRMIIHRSLHLELRFSFSVAATFQYLPVRARASFWREVAERRRIHIRIWVPHRYTLRMKVVDTIFYFYFF
jgi:hypothetical protein